VKFELVVNPRSAKTLGIELPASLLIRNEVSGPGDASFSPLRFATMFVICA
jgi:hypothetical protein